MVAVPDDGRDMVAADHVEDRISVDDKPTFDPVDVISEIEDAAKIYVPDETDEFIPARTNSYVPFLVLSTFWVVAGCGVSSMYYFKPYSNTLTSYAVQLLSWGWRTFRFFACSFSLNPGPWNAKEHALIVVAYRGSCYAAYGLGPLSALELYYDRKLSPGWGILFLLTTQMIGYGFAGIFRDILVRPPKIYYPGVLPNFAQVFSYVAITTFIWQWLPGFIFPLLSSIPLLCYFAHGQWKGYVLGSGYYGFGMLDISLDWNSSTFWQPLYTPLWANASQIGGALVACWLTYPILYFTNTLNAPSYPPMSSGTFDDTGAKYNITPILTPQYTLDQTAVNEYSMPRWSISYAMAIFWGFACSTSALVYAGLWYGKDSYVAIVEAWKSRRDDYNDPYLKLMSRTARVPHWWYLTLLAACFALSLGCVYGAEIGLPWWGFVIICVVSAICTFPNVGMAYLSEILAGGLFPGNPDAFGFYMKIPEKEMFWAQVYGTLLGLFVNYGVMRLIIDHIGAATLLGKNESNSWLAMKTRNYYSLSVLWGILGPKMSLSEGSDYSWVYWEFLLGPALVTLVYMVHRFRPNWELATRCNPVVIMYGATLFPVNQTTNLMISGALSVFFMGYMLRYRPVWFRKYNYLLGVGLDCGSQITQTIMMFAINLPYLSMPFWWGNDERGNLDRCFPPADLPPNALNLKSNV
ncbi:isp4 protein [Podospora didyma]|uniref:Isp4 protein n=1 Tax=Podospora didyma TaxID=330526 RepID=A0AAE0NP28_9PEZI|nr:isp4 protein [Podospora didyma]